MFVSYSVLTFVYCRMRRRGVLFDLRFIVSFYLSNLSRLARCLGGLGYLVAFEFRWFLLVCFVYLVFYCFLRFVFF